MRLGQHPTFFFLEDVLVFVELQAKLQLVMGLIDRSDRFDPVSAEIVGGMLKMVLCVFQRPHGCANLRMSFSRGRGGRRQR
jgi:hypothetical protein